MLTFTGQVVAGHGVGRTLGYPTLNFVVPETVRNKDFYSLLEPGVYACRIELSPPQSPFSKKERRASKDPLQGGQVGGILFFGPRGTFDETKLVLEVHLFDLPAGQTDLHPETAELEIIKNKIREPKKFENPEELKNQIQKDCEAAREILRKENQDC
jgi:FAD synthase